MGFLRLDYIDSLKLEEENKPGIGQKLRMVGFFRINIEGSFGWCYIIQG